MGSLNVDSLFTLFENNEKVEGLSETEFEEILYLVTIEPIIFLIESSRKLSIQLKAWLLPAID